MVFPNAADTTSSTYKHVTSSFRTHLLANGTLFIDDVQKSDSGLYLCRASNGIGTDLSKVIRVSVHGKWFFPCHSFCHTKLVKELVDTRATTLP